MDTEIINVHIGEVKTGSGAVQLQTILGSCIGLGFLWRKRGLYGIAHCLLPDSRGKDYEFGARYVDQAIYSLIQSMSITDTRQIRAVVAGGGNMTRQDGDKVDNLVGTLNAKSAEQELKANGIRILQQETGGSVGRKLTIDCATGEFMIHDIPRLQAQKL